MDYTDTKKLICDNYDMLFNFLPNFSRDSVKDTFDKIFKVCEEECELDNKTKCNINRYSRSLLETCLKGRLSNDDRKLMEAVCDLFTNIDANFDIIDDKLSLQAFSSVCLSSRTFDELVVLMMCLYERIGSCVLDEPSTSFLSRKYYSEISSFMNRRKSHDEPYSTH